MDEFTVAALSHARLIIEGFAGREGGREQRSFWRTRRGGRTKSILADPQGAENGRMEVGTVESDRRVRADRWTREGTGNPLRGPCRRSHARHHSDPHRETETGRQTDREEQEPEQRERERENKKKNKNKKRDQKGKDEKPGRCPTAY